MRAAVLSSDVRRFMEEYRPKEKDMHDHRCISLHSKARMGSTRREREREGGGGEALGAHWRERQAAES
jgi:hypothetical protein